MRRPITDTLLLRTVESETDVQKLIDFCNVVFSETDEPDPRIGGWVSALLEPGNHPTLTRDDYFLVEDTTSGEIVSSLNLIPQTWTYDGIPFGVGRPELVGTLKAYRRRGLVRELFKTMHERCEELGLPVQGITGITHYYRQFEYEYALDLGGGDVIALSSIPDAPASTQFAMREWQPSDLPQLEALYTSAIRNKLIACLRPAEHWHYRFSGQAPESIEKKWLYTITQADEIIGYLVIPLECMGACMRVLELVLAVPYPDVIPWLLPRLRDEVSVRFSDADPAITSLYFNLGSHYPARPYLRGCYPAHRLPYAWYIRVPDLAVFIRQIAPALERRIARGPLAGLTRSLILDFYTGGIRLDFDAGQLVQVDNLPRGVENADGAFPSLVFLQLLFGYKSLSQICQWFPDVMVTIGPTAHPILDTLFPRKPSWVMELY